jgi:hypothetical protein
VEDFVEGFEKDMADSHRATQLVVQYSRICGCGTWPNIIVHMQRGYQPHTNHDPSDSSYAGQEKDWAFAGHVFTQPQASSWLLKVNTLVGSSVSASGSMSFSLSAFVRPVYLKTVPLLVRVSIPLHSAPGRC